MYFEDVRNTLLIEAFADAFLDDEEFIILYDYYQPVNPPFPDWDFNPFCSDVFDSCECEAHFRVAKDDIAILLNAFLNASKRVKKWVYATRHLGDHQKLGEKLQCQGSWGIG